MIIVMVYFSLMNCFKEGIDFKKVVMVIIGHI